MLALDVTELDYDPELLNTPEATYDLTQGTGGGHPHDPDDLITKITACSPGDKGEGLWQESLDLFFCHDRELIQYVQEIVGMAAVGRVYAEQMIIAYGGGANGKSTFWNTIARVLGTYSGKISADALTMSCKRNVKPEMAELKGKRLIIASELEEGQRLNTGMVKQICSVDPIEAEKKYKDPFHFVPSHTLVLYTNYLPKVSANDDGTWRRLIVIPFNAKITGKSDIKNYSDYLFNHAGPAIMKWIIEGAESAIRKGFKFDEPQAVRDAVENTVRTMTGWDNSLKTTATLIRHSQRSPGNCISSTGSSVCKAANTSEALRISMEIWKRLDFSSSNKEGQSYPWLEAERRTRLPGLILER